jgi:hypothetical protein
MIRRLILPLLAVIAAALSLAVPHVYAGSATAHKASAGTPRSIVQKPRPVITAPALLAPTSSLSTAPMSYIGTLLNYFQFVTPQGADRMMQDEQTDGLNTAEIRFTWKFQEPYAQVPLADGTDLPQQYLDAACNTVIAASQHGMKAVIFNLVPKYYMWPTVGDHAALAAYDADLVLFIKQIYSCLPTGSTLQIMVMPGNEPNVKSECGYQDKNQQKNTPVTVRQQMCAAQAAQLQHSVYATIQQEEAKYSQMLGRAVDMPVCGLGLSSNDAPLVFMGYYAAARQNADYTTPDMDVACYHPYTMANTTIQSLSGFKLELRYAQAVKMALGVAVPVLEDEFGWPTSVSLDAKQGYAVCATGDPNSVDAEPENLYLNQLLEPAIELAASQPGLIGLINFQYQDDKCTTGWHTAWRRPDGSEKSFVVSFRSWWTLFKQQLKSSSRN